MSEAKYKEAYDYFRSQGYSAAQSAGIVGNLAYESGGAFNTKARGDFINGRYTAFGIAQWRNERVAKFKEIIGKDLRNSSFADQLRFVAWELNNTHKNAKNDLLKTTDISSATRVVMNKYEIPSESAKRNSINDRIEASERAYYIGQGATMPSATEQAKKGAIDGIKAVPIPGLPGVTVGTAIDGVPLIDEAAEQLGSGLSWFIGFIPRGIAIITGVALVIISIVVLLGKSEIVLETAKAVKPL